MKRRKPFVIAAAILLAGVATTLLIMLLSHSAQRQAPEPHIAELPDPCAGVQPASYEPPLDAEQRLRQALEMASTENGRTAALDDFRTDPEARSSNSVLRSTMIADSSPKVRAKAFEVAKALALREDRTALISILREGVRNPYSEVRREGLRACRDHPHYELIEELIEVADQGDRDRSVAIQALAFLDDPVAQQRVLTAAQSTNGTREERIQAITLLSRTELPEAVEYLRELAMGEDTELQAFAMEALNIWQQRNN